MDGMQGFGDTILVKLDDTSLAVQDYPGCSRKSLDLIVSSLTLELLLLTDYTTTLYSICHRFVAYLWP